jgi:chemotaxis protein CheZ
MSTPATKPVLEPIELGGFKAKANQLMNLLQGNDLEGALRCINEINLINNQHVHEVLGKITRGLHNAISDLNVSTANDQSAKNKTRAGLAYVLEVTSNAAQKALDMTEQTQQQVQTISSGQDELNVLLKGLQASSLDVSQQKMVTQLSAIIAANSVALQQIGRNNTEIVIAQNFQDLTSQSIHKAIKIITDVENSLIALTQHTNLLKQLSLISTSPDLLETHVSEELKQNLNKIESPPTPLESEHLDQDEVDNLLSSLGF